MYRALVIAIIAALAVLAQDAAHTAGAPFVRATGDASIDSKPDQATVNIGVTSQAPTAADAANQNAAQVTAVLSRIKKEIGAKGDIRTTGYSITPDYNYPGPNNKGGPKIVGYTASNTLRVKLDDIDMVGRVLDAATAAGANNVHGIQFSIKDEQGVRAQALRQAAQNARMAAEAMATALGLRVVRVHSAETGQASIVRPMMQEMASMARVAAAPTPVEAGNVQTRATVTITLEVAP